MKKIIKKIEIEIEKLREIVQNREDKVDDMSAQWQESEKCDEWLDITAEIEEQVDQLELAADELKNLI